MLAMPNALSKVISLQTYQYSALFITQYAVLEMQLKIPPSLFDNM